MLFKILSISHGWFEVDFNREFILVNSGFMGCDAPYLLLEALGDLAENKDTEAWLCWQGEPGVTILNLEKQDDRLIVRVYDTDDSLEYINYLQPDHTERRLSEYAAGRLYKTEDDFVGAVRNILDEFALYENGNGRIRYEKHWGEFPQEPYHRVRRLLRGK